MIGGIDLARLENSSPPVMGAGGFPLWHPKIVIMIG